MIIGSEWPDKTTWLPVLSSGWTEVVVYMVYTCLRGFPRYGKSARPDAINRLLVARSGSGLYCGLCVVYPWSILRSHESLSR